MSAMDYKTFEARNLGDRLQFRLMQYPIDLFFTFEEFRELRRDIVNQDHKTIEVYKSDNLIYIKFHKKVIVGFSRHDFKELCCEIMNFNPEVMCVKHG